MARKGAGVQILLAMAEGLFSKAFESSRTGGKRSSDRHLTAGLAMVGRHWALPMAGTGLTRPSR